MAQGERRKEVQHQQFGVLEYFLTPAILSLKQPQFKVFHPCSSESFSSLSCLLKPSIICHKISFKKLFLNGEMMHNNLDLIFLVNYMLFGYWHETADSS